MDKFTTSAQKTLLLPTDLIIETLVNELSKGNDLQFRETKISTVKEAKLKDVSKLVIAAFEKENGKTLAMIDFKDLPATNSRADVQNDLKQKLDSIFNKF